MNIDLMRRVDRQVGSLACALLSPFLGGRTRAGLTEMRPKKFLVILLSEMGSLVLARPMFRRIREKYPEAETFVLLFARNREALDLLGEVALTHAITLRDTSFLAFAADSLRALKRIRGLGIDTVLDCELFARISALFSGLSGAGVRVGFHPHTQEGLYRGSFLNRPVLYNPYLHMSRQFLNLLEAVAAPEQRPRVKEMPPGQESLSFPDVPLDATEQRNFQAKLRADFPAMEGKKLVLLSPGGGLLPIRAWPPANYAAVARDFISRGFVVGIIGLAPDKELAQGIVASCASEACVDLTGYTKSLRELLLLFSEAVLLLGNDGGPGHFATLVSLPALILFGPETPALYGPLGPRAKSLFAPTACAPCLTAYNHRNSPCDGNNLCLRNITPEEVINHAHALLES